MSNIYASRYRRDFKNRKDCLFDFLKYLLLQMHLMCTMHTPVTSLTLDIGESSIPRGKVFLRLIQMRCHYLILLYGFRVFQF